MEKLSTNVFDGILENFKYVLQASCGDLLNISNGEKPTGIDYLCQEIFS